MRKKINTKHLHDESQLEAEYKKASVMDEMTLLSSLNCTADGLSAEEAEKRLEQYGENRISDNKKTPWFIFLLKSFSDTFIIVLILLGIVSFVLSDELGAMIIFVLAFASAFIRFIQDYKAYVAGEKLNAMIHTHVDVRRDGALTKVDIEKITVGDAVELGSGSIIPADLYVIKSKDLFISQSMFTGESVPVEKKAGVCDSSKDSTELDNICLMGCNVVSGSGVGIVIKVGRETYLGSISKTAEKRKGQTNFEKGIASITKTMIRYMIIVVLGVFFINGIIKKDWFSALMFAVSVAVGVTPDMLPMIVNSTLSKGAQFLAGKKTIVKNISSIQNLGAIDVLCTDKTGTLTADSIDLQRYMNVNGEDDRNILDCAYLNSYFSTGIKNLIDRAVLSYGDAHGVREDIAAYKKIDEIPFDYDRKRVSVVIENEEGKHRLIAKGAMEEIIKICAFVNIDNGNVPLTDEMMKNVMSHADELNADGMHVIAAAQKYVQIDVNAFTGEDEKEMSFLGYIAFLDPPKPDVAEAIRELYAAGVDVKVISGDAPLVVRHICNDVGMRAERMLTGMEIESMSDAELKKAVEDTNIFARFAPMQKQRVVDALRANGHVVGYMGDGVNDAPSLRHADVGISVDTATDIAKESSDIILLEKSLMVLKDGVYEGRRIYGNIMKYMKMALSSNFGNVFSVLIASIFLPFLPMIPIQILIQNLIYDFTQIAIPWDNVDSEFMLAPKKWDIKGLSRFMNVMGATSSVFDMATFAVLYFALGYCTADKQAFFQTGWFIEGLISQTMIVHFIRTSKIPFIQSRADVRLIFATVCGIAAAILAPYVLYNINSFHFILMPAVYYIYLVGILISYATLIEIVKKIYIKKTGGWL